MSARNQKRRFVLASTQTLNKYWTRSGPILKMWVTHYRIPNNLESRFNWLAAGDAHVKQDLLNYLRSKEKTLVVDGARIRLPVMLDHLRGEAGQYTHRLAEVLKIGNHELELLMD